MQHQRQNASIIIKMTKEEKKEFTDALDKKGKSIAGFFREAAKEKLGVSLSRWGKK